MAITPEKQFELTVTAEIRDRSMGGAPGLQIRESIRLDAASFLELAKILGQFHDLTKAIESNK